MKKSKREKTAEYTAWARVVAKLQGAAESFVDAEPALDRLSATGRKLLLAQLLNAATEEAADEAQACIDARVRSLKVGAN